jgi:hypothetical protein
MVLCGCLPPYIHLTVLYAERLPQIPLWVFMPAHRREQWGIFLGLACSLSTALAFEFSCQLKRRALYRGILPGPVRPLQTAILDPFRPSRICLPLQPTQVQSSGVVQETLIVHMANCMEREGVLIKPQMQLLLVTLSWQPTSSKICNAKTATSENLPVLSLIVGSGWQRNNNHLW